MRAVMGKQYSRLAIIGSGSGSNAQAILDASASGALPLEVSCVISDVADAYILERARKAGIPAIHLDCAPFKTKLDGAAQDRALEILRDHGTDLVALAGFMRMVKQGLIDAFPHRILNIHPALLPAFPGLQSWKQALDYGAKVAGCTVHFVDLGMDTGPIIVQKAVPVLEGDTPETLHSRIQEQEHPAYLEALRLVAEGQTRIEGRKVIISP